MEEAGLKGFEVVGFYGVLAPAGTKDIVDKLSAALRTVLADPDTKAKLEFRGRTSVAVAGRLCGDDRQRAEAVGTGRQGIGRANRLIWQVVKRWSRACPTTALPQSCEGRAFSALPSLVESARKASQRSICTRIDRASGKPKASAAA
jgi:hypothetical protein